MWPRDERPGVLETKQGAEAAAEFQKILDHRGWLLYTFASVGIARLASRRHCETRKAYQDFIALWKDADPDIPILVKAKQEYEQLK